MLINWVCYRGQIHVQWQHFLRLIAHNNCNNCVPTPFLYTLHSSQVMLWGLNEQSGYLVSLLKMTHWYQGKMTGTKRGRRWCGLKMLKMMMLLTIMIMMRMVRMFFELSYLAKDLRRGAGTKVGDGESAHTDKTCNFWNTNHHHHQCRHRQLCHHILIKAHQGQPFVVLGGWLLNSLVADAFQNWTIVACCCHKAA